MLGPVGLGGRQGKDQGLRETKNADDFVKIDATACQHGTGGASTFVAGRGSDFRTPIAHKYLILYEVASILAKRGSFFIPQSADHEFDHPMAIREVREAESMHFVCPLEVFISSAVMGTVENQPELSKK